jgi:outer membrane protein OmpA-like peptidoglycan-associated protein
LFTLGVSWSTPEEKHIPMGAISGTVKDAGTNQPIMARVMFPGTEIGSMNATSMGFKADSLTPGIYTVEVMAEGYESDKKTVTVVDGQMAQLSFNLKPIQVSLSGAVHDRKTDAGIPARIRFVDSDMKDIETDPSTGLYKIMLEPGTYGLEVSSEGYLSQTASVNVGKDGTVKDFKLIKKGMKISFQGINFETGKATILPESYPILDEAAKVLKENPTVRVEVGGHTDSQGSASSNMTLSQKRAESVRLYLIENDQIEGNRLLAKGYGESQPVAANDTKENMAKNRRVEFTILEQ